MISPVLTPTPAEQQRTSGYARLAAVVLAGALVFVEACSLISALPGGVASGRPVVGTASFYGNAHAGKRTASGERYDPSAMTAAHPSLPFGTRVRVTNLANGRSVVVRVNDRGPYIPSRTIDVSLAAARALGFTGSGVARVRVQRLR